MFRKKLAVSSFILVACISVLHFIATTFYWYLVIPWFDMAMHTLGGIFLAMFGATLFSGSVQRSSSAQNFFLLLSIVFIVGFGWEIFEYIVQFVIRGSVQLANVPDSISDMVCDVVGGILGFFFVLIQKRRYNRKHE